MIARWVGLIPRRAVAQELQHLGREQPDRADRQLVGAIVVLLVLADRLEIGAEDERRAVDQKNMVAGADGTSELGHGGDCRQGRRRGLSGGAETELELATMMAVHPGRVLRREMAGARTCRPTALALALRTPSGRVTDILNGKRGVSPETAMRLARYFGNSARFWLNLADRLRTRAGGTRAWREDRRRSLAGGVGLDGACSCRRAH